MKSLIVVSIFVSLNAFADTTTALAPSTPVPTPTTPAPTPAPPAGHNYGISAGPSVPSALHYNNIDQDTGITRRVGGEHIVFKFDKAETISDIKITDYSTSRKGATLVHAVKATLKGKSLVSPELKTLFGKMLNDNESAATQLNQVTDKLDFQVEGYKNNDASLVIEFTSPDGNTKIMAERDYPPAPSAPPDTDGRGGGCVNGGQFGMCVDGSLCCTGLGCDDGSTCSAP